MNQEDAIKAAIPDGSKYTSKLKRAMHDLCEERKKLK
jgi:hypothetical protein